MFTIQMPAAFRVGDTAATTINGEDTSLTWRDADTLVIGDDDVRKILILMRDPHDASKLTTFYAEPSLEPEPDPTPAT